MWSTFTEPDPARTTRNTNRRNHPPRADLARGLAHPDVRPRFQTSHRTSSNSRKLKQRRRNLPLHRRRDHTLAHALLLRRSHHRDGQQQLITPLFLPRQLQLQPQLLQRSPPAQPVSAPSQTIVVAAAGVVGNAVLRRNRPRRDDTIITIIIIIIILPLHTISTMTRNINRSIVRRRHLHSHHRKQRQRRRPPRKTVESNLLSKGWRGQDWSKYKYN